VSALPRLNVFEILHGPTLVPCAKTPSPFRRR
jgi:hypothetical protein